MAYPMDTYHVYCIEGAGSNAGSLSSLSSAIPEEDFSYDSLQQWGPKFEGLKELYQRPEVGFANTDVVQSLSHTGGRSFEQQH